MKSVLLAIPVGLGSVFADQSWKKLWCFYTRQKDPFIADAGRSLSAFLRLRFSIYSQYKCSLVWSLSLSHAVLACKCKIWLLIHHSCLALLLITFLAVWEEAENMTLHDLAGSTILVGFVNNQQLFMKRTTDSGYHSRAPLPCGKVEAIGIIQPGENSG